MLEALLLAQIGSLSKSPIKSVQRGVTSGSGNITINPVDPSKTIVLSRSKGSAGYVAARGDFYVYHYDLSSSGDPFARINGRNWSFGYLTGGSTDLTTKEYSAKLVNSTTISCDGPVEWQVIEFV